MHFNFSLEGCLYVQHYVLFHIALAFIEMSSLFTEASNALKYLNTFTPTYVNLLLALEILKKIVFSFDRPSSTSE